MKKSVSLFLFATIFLQSCVIYHKTSVSLDEAFDKGKVRVVTPTGEKLKFKNIIKQDSVYYGINRKKMKNEYGGYEWRDIVFKISPDGANAIYLKDQKNSTFATIGLIIAIPVGVILGTIIFWSVVGVPL